jgi:hypothetical protein
VVAVVGAGVVTGVFATAGVVVVLAAAGLGVVLAVAGVVGVVAAAAVALGDVLAAGDFLSFRLVADFLSAGVMLGAGCSAEVFVSGVVAGVAGLRFGGPFLSTFGGGGGSFAAGSFTAGASVFGACGAAGSFTAGASDFGAIVGAGFSARGFFPGASFLVGGAADSSGEGCWAITAPASASEATISKLVIFFMVALLLVGIRRRSIQPWPFFLAQSIDRLTVIIRASVPVRFPSAVVTFAIFCKISFRSVNKRTQSEQRRPRWDFGLWPLYFRLSPCVRVAQSFVP